LQIIFSNKFPAAAVQVRWATSRTLTFRAHATIWTWKNFFGIP